RTVPNATNMVPSGPSCSPPMPLPISDFGDLTVEEDRSCLQPRSRFPEDFAAELGVGNHVIDVEEELDRLLMRRPRKGWLSRYDKGWSSPVRVVSWFRLTQALSETHTRRVRRSLSVPALARRRSPGDNPGREPQSVCPVPERSPGLAAPCVPVEKGARKRTVTRHVGLSAPHTRADTRPARKN